MADDCGFVKGESQEFVEKLLGIVRDKLVQGEEVMISGFRKWTVKSKHARKRRNPQMRKEMMLDARRVVTWSYSCVLKRAANEANANG